MSSLRKVIWIAAGILLLVPLVAMRFTDAVNWSVSDFVFAGILIFAALASYEAAARTTGNTAYRSGAAIAIAAVFLLVWINAAVGITDTEADWFLFLTVPTVGMVGALLARFRPRGMALAMLITATVPAIIGGIALLAGIVPAHNPPMMILGITGFFAALFAGSAGLFWKAGQTGGQPGAV